MGAAYVADSGKPDERSGQSLYAPHQLGNRGEFVLDPGLPRFAGVLLAYVIVLAALATLSPFDFVWSKPHGYSIETSIGDVALNLAFLFPVGFLFRLARRGRGGPMALDALALGLGVSLVLELLQAFLPSRVTSPTDVATNGLGAWAGAITHARLGPWLDRRLQKQLSLHLPLANILYLLVPLLALDALSSDARHECLFEVPLIVFMAFLAAGLYTHRLVGNERPFAGLYACSIGALFGIGYLPMCVRAWQLWLFASVLCVGCTRLLIEYGTRLPNTERRFVPVMVRRALPWFLVYLVALAASPLLSRWLDVPGLSAAAALEGGEARALTLLREVAAFTLLGYLVSELHARSALPPRVVMARVLSVACVAALGFFALRWHSGPDFEAGPSRVILLACAVLAGSGIHRAQLKLVRSWGRTQPPPRTD
jgi:glycopeptide antibiotics resistance protein